MTDRYGRLDVAKLTPAERAAREVVLRAHERQLVQDIDDHDARIAIWAAEHDAKAREDALGRLRERASRAHEVATQRRGAASREVDDHLIRAADPATSAELRTVEESLALEAYGRELQWRELQQRTAARVIESPVYAANSPNSYFRDLANALSADPSVSGPAMDRLGRYGRGLAHDATSTPEGRHALRCWRAAVQPVADREQAQARQAQYRAMSTSSASGGALVAPMFLIDDTALYRSPSAVVWRQLVATGDLPDYGMTVSVPKFTGPASASAPSENSTVSETDPTAAYQQASVEMYVSLVTGALQLHERTGGQFDMWIYRQLASQLDATIDLAVINAALAGANSIARATTTTLTQAQFLSDVGRGASALQTTAGTALPPTAFVAPAPIAEWLLSQVDASSGPWFRESLGARRSGDGDTGQAVAGIPFYVDSNIPTSGSNAQLIVLNRGAVEVYGGTEIPDVLTLGAGASNLSVTWRLRSYVAPVVRFAAGVSTLSGTGYPASPTWA